MAMKYAGETPLAALDPVELGIRLAEVMAESTPWLEGVSGLRASVAPAEGKWSAKQVLGHLTDSAVNNLQRIVRLETLSSDETELQSMHYAQEEWVRAQHYEEKEWVQVLQLWRVLNEHIAWTMRQVTREHLGRICVFPDTRVTMGYVMEDYIAHLEYHLKALRDWL